MLSKRIFNLLFSLLILIVIVVSCANPVAPVGGIKDEIPPRFLGSNPVNKARNFSSRRIYLSFDEFLVLKDLNKQMLISPPMKNKLDVKTKGKGVSIRIDDKEILAENTTYTLYFGDAITDLHENNPYSNFQYVFATGSEIDSLSIRGKVLSGQYLQPEEEIYVCLYIDNNDTLSLHQLPQNVRPYYIAKTNPKGYFELNNIRNQAYLIFAVSDANSNYINDIPTEQIAFVNELILPEEVFDFIPDSFAIDTANKHLMDSLWKNHAVQLTKKTHTLLLFEPQDSVAKISKSELIDGNRMHFEFKYPLKSKANISVLSPKNKESESLFLEEYSSQRDTLDLWFYKPLFDTVSLLFQMDTLRTDTMNIIFKAPTNQAATANKKGKPIVQQSKEKPNYIAYSNNFSPSFPFFLKGKIVFKTPIKTANFDNCTLLEENKPVKFNMQFLDSAKRKLEIDYLWKEDKNYRFEIPDQAITDIYNFKNDSIVFNFKTTAESNYGEIKLLLQLPKETNSTWIIQLFKGAEDKEKVIIQFTATESQALVFKNLASEKYRIKVIEDLNHDGRWTNGDYAKKQLPEKVFYYAPTIEIKAGWKVEEAWLIKYDVQENPSFIKQTKKEDK